jgi:hypothetical protein
MSAMVRRPLLLACLAGPLLVGCQACHEQVGTHTLSDAQLARVTEGTGTPTPRGCNVVCWEVSRGLDGGTVDGGLPTTRFEEVTCTLAGHRLRCDYGRVCEV